MSGRHEREREREAETDESVGSALLGVPSSSADHSIRCVTDESDQSVKVAAQLNWIALVGGRLLSRSMQETPEAE
jgi:hypothetical protein